MSHTVAILPIKHFASAKSRLGEHDLPADLRRALAEAMMCDVLIALRRSERVDEVVVVTGEERAMTLAESYDAAEVIADDDAAGHNGAARLGVEAAVRRGAGRVLLVAGDCPLLDHAELDLLLGEDAAVAVQVIPDRDGSGTNGLVLSPPDVIAPAFGIGSRDRHEELARAAGVACKIAEVASMALDIDRPEDLDTLRGMLGAGRGRAAMTRGLLAQSGWL